MKNIFRVPRTKAKVSPKYIKSIEGNRIFIGAYIIPIGKMYKSNIGQLLK